LWALEANSSTTPQHSGIVFPPYVLAEVHCTDLPLSRAHLPARLSRAPLTPKSFPNLVTTNPKHKRNTNATTQAT
jgi:hypothetical protein